MTGLKKAIAALVVGATMTGAVASAAEAQRWRGGGPGYGRGYGGGYGYGGGRYYGGRRGGVGTGAAIGLGLLGLGVGAAIASRPRYGYYGAPQGGYGYGAPGYGYGGYDAYYGEPVVNCYVQRVWDPYIGATVQQRICQ